MVLCSVAFRTVIEKRDYKVYDDRHDNIHRLMFKGKGCTPPLNRDSGSILRRLLARSKNPDIGVGAKQRSRSSGLRGGSKRVERHLPRVDPFFSPAVHDPAMSLFSPPVGNVRIVGVPAAFDSGSSFQAEYRGRLAHWSQRC